MVEHQNRFPSWTSKRIEGESLTEEDFQELMRSARDRLKFQPELSFRGTTLEYCSDLSSGVIDVGPGSKNKHAP